MAGSEPLPSTATPEPNYESRFGRLSAEDGGVNRWRAAADCFWSYDWRGRISVSLLYALYALLRIDDPEVLDDLEFAILCLGDVHVHSNVMLTRHHLSRAARPLRDLCVVQSPDNFVLL